MRTTLSNFPLHRVICLLALLLAASFVRAQESVTITSDTIIVAGDATYDHKRLTISNCTVTIDGPHTFASLDIAGSAVVTHSAGLLSGLQISVDGDMTVGPAARIDVTGRGYGQGDGPGRGNSNLDSGASGGAGASYGGEGRAGFVGFSPGSESPYGSITNPALPGSGGGNGGGGSLFGRSRRRTDTP